MEQDIETMLEDQRWRQVGLEGLAEAALKAVLATLGLAGERFSVCVMGCDDARIAGLNAAFRGKPTPTNVLSWPAEDRQAAHPGEAPPRPVAGPGEEAIELGDIALAYDTCAREAAEAGKPMADHVSHLVVHGLLHLFGYDHVEDEDAALMEGIEVRTLAQMGLCDPYSA
ncbi:MAG: rRNA maturation RNase YbeY [Paracoccaceae bacterium]